MKVTLTQAGGYAGLVRTIELDSSQLPADEAAALATLVRDVMKEGDGPRQAPHPDAIEYEITVDEDDGRSRAIVMVDPLPPAAQRLVKFLREKATRKEP